MFLPANLAWCSVIISQSIRWKGWKDWIAVFQVKVTLTVKVQNFIECVSECLFWWYLQNIFSFRGLWVTVVSLSFLSLISFNFMHWNEKKTKPVLMIPWHYGAIYCSFLPQCLQHPGSDAAGQCQLCCWQTVRRSAGTWFFILITLQDIKV